MGRFARPQFSLATLLIAMAWSAAVVWMNVTPHFLGSTPHIFHYGWPWGCQTSTYDLFIDPDPEPVCVLGRLLSSRWYHWSLLGDIAVGLLLVVVLTWISKQLLRRVMARLRRGRLPLQSTN